jgi:hypothetical protein
MKKTISISFLLFLGVSAFSQKIKVKESSENIGGSNHNALVVTLYEVNPSDAEDAFKSCMKKYDGKRSSSDKGVFVDNAVIKEMGNNTVDIYGKALGKKGDKEITFIVAFDLGGAFLNSSEHKSQYKIAEQIVKDFAVNTTKEIIEKQLKTNQKLASKLEDEQKSLVKENEDLTNDIADYKEKIKKAEADLATNKTDQEKKKAEVEAQKKVVDDVDKKLKSIE